MQKLWMMVPVFLTSLFSGARPAPEEDTLKLNTNHAILVEPMSGHVLYEKNSEEKCYPASMTKMMAMYVTMKELNQGSITLNDSITVSSYAASMGGTQIYLEEGETMPLEDILTAVCVNSANDAVVALGEFLSGSNDAFIDRLNQEAKKMNLVNTHFVNTTGFDDPNHYSCPKDMAEIARNLLQYPDILKYTSMKEAYVRKDSASPFWLVNTNKLMQNYKGMDGLKTGYTKASGYNLTATAKRDSVRLLSVVMNEESIEKRSADTTKLLNYGFSKYIGKKLYRSGQILAHYHYDGGDQEEMGIRLVDDVILPMLKDEENQEWTSYIDLMKVDLPVKEGEMIGHLVVIYQEREFRFPVVAEKDVRPMGFLDFFRAFLRDFLA